MSARSYYPPSEGVRKMLVVARDQILKYNNFKITEHCQERITEQGRMSWEEIRDTIANGDMHAGNRNPTYFAGVFKWKEMVVVVGTKFSDKNNDGVLHTYIITCYKDASSDADAEYAFLTERTEEVKTEIIERQVEKVVYKGLDEMSEDELAQMLAKRKAEREEKEREAENARRNYLLSEQARLTKILDETQSALLLINNELGIRATRPSGRVGRPAGRTSTNYQRYWDENYHRFYHPDSSFVNINKMATELGIPMYGLHDWVAKNHPERIKRMPRRKAA